MIPRSYFTKVADRQGLDAKTVERDYMLTHVLGAISKQGGHGLVFKGGTALRLCYFEDYRYSADLDFSLIGDVQPSHARKAIETGLAVAAGQTGFPLLTVALDGKRIDYVGPLGKQRSLKLDLATDETVEGWERLPLLPEIQGSFTRRSSGESPDGANDGRARCTSTWQAIHRSSRPSSARFAARCGRS